MEKLHKLNLIIADLEGYDINIIIEYINRVLNGVSTNSIVKVIEKETKNFVWEDSNPLNFSDITPEKAMQYYENIENDEYQQYLKLKDKYENGN